MAPDISATSDSFRMGPEHQHEQPVERAHVEPAGLHGQSEQRASADQEHVRVLGDRQGKQRRGRGGDQVEDPAAHGGRRVIGWSRG